MKVIVKKVERYYINDVVINDKDLFDFCSFFIDLLEQKWEISITNKSITEDIINYVSEMKAHTSDEVFSAHKENLIKVFFEGNCWDILNLLYKKSYFCDNTKDPTKVFYRLINEIKNKQSVFDNIANNIENFDNISYWDKYYVISWLLMNGKVFEQGVEDKEAYLSVIYTKNNKEYTYIIRSEYTRIPLVFGATKYLSARDYEVYNFINQAKIDIC